MPVPPARKTVAIGLAVVLGTLCAAPIAGIRLNHTPSMPLGVWIERGKDAAHVYVTGDVVEVCPRLAEWQRVYLAPGDCPNRLEPMLKPVAAVSGDTVAIDPDGVTVNGVLVPDSAPLAHDTQGRTLLPYPAGRYTVAANQVWLLVPYADSLDSRYLGPVSTSDIRHLAAPVLVWK